jgi:Aspartyl protease
MPCISGSYNPAVGPLLQVVVLPQSQIQSGQGSKASVISGANLPVFMALADTGASATCISSHVAQTVGLQPSGKTTMSGSTGQNTVDQYTFLLGFMLGATQDPSGHISGSLHTSLVQGCEFTNHGFGFDVLLGRDVLCKGSFSLSFDGHFILSL